MRAGDGDEPPALQGRDSGVERFGARREGGRHPADAVPPAEEGPAHEVILSGSENVPWNELSGRLPFRRGSKKRRVLSIQRSRRGAGASRLPCERSHAFGNLDPDAFSVRRPATMEVIEQNPSPPV